MQHVLVFQELLKADVPPQGVAMLFDPWAITKEISLVDIHSHSSLLGPFPFLSVQHILTMPGLHTADGSV